MAGEGSVSLVLRPDPVRQIKADKRLTVRLWARLHNQRGHEASVLRLLGDIVAREPSRGVNVEQHYKEAMALAVNLGMRSLVAHCHLGLGRLYRRTGDQAEAEKHLATAATMYREMDMGFWLEKAEAELEMCH